MQCALDPYVFFQPIVGLWRQAEMDAFLAPKPKQLSKKEQKKKDKQDKKDAKKDAAKSTVEGDGDGDGDEA